MSKQQSKEHAHLPLSLGLSPPTEKLNLAAAVVSNLCLFFLLFLLLFPRGGWEGVAAYVGWQSSCILKPLLQQGLSDTEEFVIYKALNALTCMCQLGLLQKPHIYEFVSDIGNYR